MDKERRYQYVLSASQADALEQMQLIGDAMVQEFLRTQEQHACFVQCSYNVIQRPNQIKVANALVEQWAETVEKVRDIFSRDEE